jgi:ABC-type sulfate/molybdate transport systems ATPase subunit
MGPNGCGKVYLLRVCAMLEAPDAGSIRFTDAGNELQQDWLFVAG